MADTNPWDDYAVSASVVPQTVTPQPTAQQPTAQQPTAQQPTPAPAPDDTGPWADYAAPAAPAPAPLSQEDATSKYSRMFSDPTVSGDQLRAYYRAISGQDVNAHDDKIIADRDAFRAAHHGQAGNVQVGALPFDASADNSAVDTRPTSFGLGMVEGGHHVLANVAGGAGFLANKVGLSNDWGNELQHYYDSADQASRYQGSGAGKLVGSIMAAAPAALIAAPISAGVGALGAGDAIAGGAGMLADGAAQSALTTDQKTVGGVARDATIGGVLGLGFGTAAHGLSALASRPTAAAVQGRAVLDAAGRLSRDGATVSALPAEVGGPLTRGLNAVGEAGLVANIPLGNAVDRHIATLDGVRQRVAQSFVPQGVAPRTIDAAADGVLTEPGGLGRYEEDSARQGSALYDQARNQAGDARIPMPRTVATINDILGELHQSTVPDVGSINQLTALRDRLSAPVQVTQPTLIQRLLGARPQTVVGDTPEFSVQGARMGRTELGKNYDAADGLDRGIARRLYAPQSADIQEGLRAQGLHGAADAYQAADQFHATRLDNLENVVEPILADRSREQLAKKLVGMTQDDHELLGRGLDLMSPTQAGHVRAALVNNLGRANSGVQNAVGDRFSLASFGTDWDKLAPGLKQSMLSGQSGQDLQDLAVIAEASKRAGMLRNTSGTGRVAEGLHRIGQIASGGAGYLTFGKSLAAEGALGTALSSPAVARGIVRAGEIRPIAHTSAALAALGRRTAPTIADGDDN